LHTNGLRGELVGCEARLNALLDLSGEDLDVIVPKESFVIARDIVNIEAALRDGAPAQIGLVLEVERLLDCPK